MFLSLFLLVTIMFIQYETSSPEKSNFMQDLWCYIAFCFWWGITKGVNSFFIWWTLSLCFHSVPLTFLYFLDKDDDDSNDRDRKDRKDDSKSSKERSSKDKVGLSLVLAFEHWCSLTVIVVIKWTLLLLLCQEKKQMVTHNRELLMAFVYFDQSHCGYLLERDLEEILYTLGLHLSRAQVNTQTRTNGIISIVCSCVTWLMCIWIQIVFLVPGCFQIKKLLNKPVVRESCYYRKLTDRGKDEPTSSFNEALIENLLGNDLFLMHIFWSWCSWGENIGILECNSTRATLSSFHTPHSQHSCSLEAYLQLAQGYPICNISMTNHHQLSWRVDVQFVLRPRVHVISFKTWEVAL